MRYQHIRYKVVYKKGKLNQTGFILRRGKPYIQLTAEEREEMNDLNSLLYIFHAIPGTEKLYLKRNTEHTKKDSVLKELSKMIH